jgi:hypothetical protein
MFTTTSSDCENPVLSPEAIISAFDFLPLKELRALAREAIGELATATTRAEAARAADKLDPFFSHGAYEFLPSSLQQALEYGFREAEKRFGKLPPIADAEMPRIQTPREHRVIALIFRLCPDRNVPQDRANAARLAAIICSVDADDYRSFTDFARSVLQGFAAELEARFGPIETLAPEINSDERSGSAAT